MEVIDIQRIVMCIRHLEFFIGDISAGNVMFYREGSEVIGVLCDWDLAYDTLIRPDGEKKVIKKPEE